MLSAEALEKHIHEGIPIAAQMGFRVIDLQPNSIAVTGGGSENINVHGTAFAGSLYTICTLALWGLVTARLPEGATLVLAEASIRYREPVVGDIDARCTIAKDTLEGFLSQLLKRGRSSLEARVDVSGVEGSAAAFNGKVYARLARE
ncbi:MAG: YiiD C-terminal domain-containing protein [Candidatus Thiodiazotropha sp.]